jgi:hypothetical protein
LALGVGDIGSGAFVSRGAIPEAGNAKFDSLVLGFNVGVEIGQACIIALLFPSLYLLRRTTFYPWIIKIGSILLGAVAAIWAVERIFERDLGIDSILEKFTRAPRVFVLVAVATLAAAGIREFEARRGRLVPLPATPTPDGAHPQESSPYSPETSATASL